MYCCCADNYKGAIEEYAKCLEIRQEIGDTRDGADVFSLMALTFYTMANTEREKDGQRTAFERAVEYYGRTRAIMFDRLRANITSAVTDADQQSSKTLPHRCDDACVCLHDALLWRCRCRVAGIREHAAVP